MLAGVRDIKDEPGASFCSQLTNYTLEMILMTNLLHQFFSSYIKS